MIRLRPDEIAALAGAEITSRGAEAHPERAIVDSRGAGPGDLFVGLRGERADGGSYAEAVIAAGAWGVLVDPERAASLPADSAWIFASEDPLASLQALASGWRERIGARVVGITGSTGKTSVKDITRALLPGRIHASPENYNTEIGLSLTILTAPEDTELLVLEMGMRGRGQITELCEIAKPDVAAITNVGPVHLELLGTLDAIAEAKAEILAGMAGGGRAVIPADAEALEPHLTDEMDTLTFGPGGDVEVVEAIPSGESGTRARIVTPAGEVTLELPFDGAHNVANASCAVAIGVALGTDLGEMAARAAGITFSRLRGERIRLARGILVINDCYNANPISMRAALDHLATIEAPRRAAVLGGMAELGPDGPAFHREIGLHARELGLGPLIGVGDLARDYDPDEWAPDPEAAVALAERVFSEGDAILVKGSRSVGLERFTDAFAARTGRPGDPGKGHQ